jgi:hypothetical protein
MKIKMNLIPLGFATLGNTKKKESLHDWDLQGR